MCSFLMVGSLDAVNGDEWTILSDVWAGFTFPNIILKSPCPFSLPLHISDTSSPDSFKWFSTGALVGLILSSIVVGIALTLLFVVACRKLRAKNTFKQNHVSASRSANAACEEEEEGSANSTYVDVPEDAMRRRRGFQARNCNAQENCAYEDYELEDIEGTRYGTANDGEYERAMREPYEILHSDDTNYTNLNREPVRQYVFIEPGSRVSWHCFWFSDQLNWYHKDTD